MASEPDEAGPSGLSHEEMLALLETSDSEKEETTSDLLCQEEMGDSDEDDLCNDLLDHLERQHQFQTQLLQQSGGALGDGEGAFEFELDPYVDRLSSRMGVRERHFKTQLRQRGNFIADENITQALQDGLRRAVNEVLATTPNLHDQDRLYFTIGSNRLHNNFQGWGLRAGEWREGGERMDALFDRLAQALNSNEQFEMDDSFQLSITQVHHAPQGTGKPRRGKPGHPTFQLLTSQKRSVSRIQNSHELCCARALVVAKAKVDQHPKEKAIRQGKSLQRTLALELQHEASVPLGPCSYDALTQFSAAPSLAHYQIILVDAHRSFHITTFGPIQDKQLILLHDHGHYDVITRLAAFSGPVMCVPTVGNPMTTKVFIDATKNAFAGPVAKKSAPISFMLTSEFSKRPDVANNVIGTFLERLVSKHISLLTIQANPQATSSPACAFFAGDAPPAESRT